MKINNLNSLFKISALLFSPFFLQAQLGVNSDNSAPHGSSMLDVKSSTKGVLIPRVSTDLASPTEGLLYYNTTGHNFRYYDGTAWQNALFGNQWNVNGTKISYSLGNVGIGVADPLYKLHVGGTFHTTGYITTDGYLGIGGSPAYKLNVFDGSLAITNTTDAKSWAFTYSSANNYLYLQESGVARHYFANGGNVGIGVNPQYKLDVAGTIHTSSGLIVDGSAAVNGSASVDGPVTVNNGGGVAYNPNTSTNLKIIPFTTGTFFAVLGPHDISPEGAIALPAGFTSTPRVFVGDIDVTGGSAGQLYMVDLQLYGCNTNSCKARLINKSAGSVNYSITWNCVAIGN